jgi:hypothetical protein
MFRNPYGFGASSWGRVSRTSDSLGDEAGGRWLQDRCVWVWVGAVRCPAGTARAIGYNTCSMVSYRLLFPCKDLHGNRHPKSR